MGSDTKRLEWVMRGIDGFACLGSKSKHEYEGEEACRNGREEPNASDRMDGIRRMIDDAMVQGALVL